MTTPLTDCVQIPLWSMNTVIQMISQTYIRLFRFLYGRWIPTHKNIFSIKIPRFRFLYGRWILWPPPVNYPQLSGSDSSMVDEYPSPTSILICLSHVQIPLWSMNTHRNGELGRNIKSSDSSMVDEYLAAVVNAFTTSAFRFLYGRWIPLSLGLSLA